MGSFRNQCLVCVGLYFGFRWHVRNHASFLCALSFINWWVVVCLTLMLFFIVFVMLGSNGSLVLDCILASLGMWHVGVRPP